MNQSLAVDTPLATRLRVQFAIDATRVGPWALAMILWMLSLSHINPDALTDIGLVSILSWMDWLAAFLLIAGFINLLRDDTPDLLWPSIYLFGLILVFHGTPAIVYQTLRYSWAWKHIGIVDFIQRHGAVDRFAIALPAYHNWPGLFIISAWIANAFNATPVGMSNVVRFAPVLMNACYLVCLYPIFRHFSANRRLIFISLLVFLCGNWIGQDYYAPQAVAYLFYLIVLWLFLGPLKKEPAKPFFIINYLPLTKGMKKFIVSRSPTELASSRSWGRLALTALSIVLMFATIATHQLTPIALILDIIALTILGRLAINFLMMACALQVGWLLYFAAPFIMLRLPDELNNVGESVALAADRLVDLAAVSPGRALVVIVGRTLTVIIGSMAIASALRSWWKEKPYGTAAVLMVAPLPMFVTSYGGEILFRVYFFCLPMLAFFAAVLLADTTGRPWGLARRCSLTALFCFFAIGFFFANNGKDRQYRFTLDEVATANWLYSTAPNKTLLIEGSRGYPSQFKNYENFTYLSMAEEQRPVRLQFIKHPAELFSRWLSSENWTDGYVVITSSQKAYSDAEGIMPPGSLDEIERQLLRSPQFVLAHSSEHAKIFGLTPGILRAGGWAGPDLTFPSSEN